MKDDNTLDAIVVYEPGVEKDGKKEFGAYRIVENNGNTAGYFFGEFVEKVERQMIAKKDDPFYQVSSTIANKLVKDRTIGSMIALGIYSVLSSFEKGDKK